MRYLTKSRFKLALECVTKLYYTRKPDEYADESLEDPFLEALAEGGFQVGELAKFDFCDDPVRQGITVDTLDTEEALRITAEKLGRPGRVVIAEAAFRHENLFVRTDILVREGTRLDIYEVKSKSRDEEPPAFIREKGEPRVDPKWVEYLYDVAFQKHVVAKALEGRGMRISAHIILVDKSRPAGVDGLNQMFRIIRDDRGRVRIRTKEGLSRDQLGDPILSVKNIDDEIRRIWDEFAVPTDYADAMGFREFVDLCAGILRDDRRVFAPLGPKCKGCNFVTPPESAGGLKSGFHECWAHHTGLGEDALRKKNLVIDLWGGKAGGRSIVGDLLAQGKYFLDLVAESDIAPGGGGRGTSGLSPHERRMEQITRAKARPSTSYFDRKGLEREMAEWVYPLHMIDFETTMTALPFHKGRRPYEGIAFQFSHHIMEKDGSIRHAGQYLSFKPGVFPNYEFVRELKRQLSGDSGSVFRYHNHENTYLNKIAGQLESDAVAEPDRDELVSFIRGLTQEGGAGGKRGKRCMIDLYDLVLRYFYSPAMRGGNSLKVVLPAVIRESKHLREKYSRPVYGRKGEVSSLNFEEHVWIDPRFGNNPYRTLGSLFEGYDTDKLDDMLAGLDMIADGGAAMTAYNYLQFSEVPADQRERLREGLLRYCELDTMAMIMLLEGWMHIG